MAQGVTTPIFRSKYIEMIITHEIIAKLIFATTQLRFFEKEYLTDPSIEMNDIVIRWRCKVDQILLDMGMQDFMPYKQLLEILKLDSSHENAA